jgi:hypothetical protein
LEFGKKEPLKELRTLNLSLDLRWGPWRFEVDRGAWTGWSWHQGVWRHWLERAASGSRSNWGCLLAVRRLWRGRRGLCVARLQSSSGTRASPPVLLMVIHWPVCSARGSACS